MEYLFSDSLGDISNEDIVARCQSGLRLSSDTNSAKVVKILPDIAVKFGIGIRQNEATTLDYVRRHISKDILRVPRIYRFFTHGEFLGMPFGYIVMEFIGGVTLEECNIGPDLIKRIINALNHLSTIPIPPSQGPGPVYGGIPQGCLWSEYGAGTPFTTLQDMETWLNQRLDLSRRQLPRFALGSTELSFSHMDIARRNIILTEEDEICFVDWAHAGFYPAYFQRFCIEWCSVDDASFIRSLLHELPGSYSNGEEYLLGEVLRINSMYPPQNSTQEG
ncbi:hypothetical protein CC80DRAFT_434155 [Byssothecium circinans]|uniref:Aminoglycoside phosphotransferase domain-containing protein n=1 Tax=Byssothecium circinans TaxID=147558 RepID=A0A6A5UD84_9PLEO|nr:hypothetical protein CC80DRAFT_434155 [Byssothecium circinans]